MCAVNYCRLLFTIYDNEKTIVPTSQLYLLSSEYLILTIYFIHNRYAVDDHARDIMPHTSLHENLDSCRFV